MASGKRTSVVTDGPILVLTNKRARNGTHDESCTETHEDKSDPIQIHEDESPVPKPEPEGTHDESCTETHEDKSDPTQIHEDASPVPKPEPEGDFIAPHASGTTVECQSDPNEDRIRVFTETRLKEMLEEKLNPKDWWSMPDEEDNEYDYDGLFESNYT